MTQKQADKKFKKAKQSITTSFFNWSKDYSSAASGFQDAFKIYKSCGLWQKALNTLKQLIVCNQKNVDSWAVARNYESMLQIYMDKCPVDDERLKKVTVDCFIQYRMSQSLDKGLQMVTKVTKYLKGKGKVSEGLEILSQAYKASLEDEKCFRKKELFGILVQSFLENELYDQTIKMYKEDITKKNGVGCQEEALIVVVLYLVMGQPKRAEQQMLSISDIVTNFLTSDECEAAENLIKYYQAGDVEKFKKQTTKAVITCLYPLIIIKKLRSVLVPSAQTFKNATTSQKEAMYQKGLY